uniref:Uncharacterized protein n=1 Tax=Octopus bimaculoides TaxID=37653 RepID=A0A0L8IA88_OCTBM
MGQRIVQLFYKLQIIKFISEQGQNQNRIILHQVKVNNGKYFHISISRWVESIIFSELSILPVSDQTSFA